MGGFMSSHVIYKQFAITGLGFILYIYSTICSALPLTLTVVQPDRIGTPGSTETFSGTITNNTGADILANDIFFDFSGFNPQVVSLTQLLGSPDFLIPDGGTTSTVSLFSFSLGTNAVAGPKYFADVFVQDGNILSSNIVTVSMSVVPEPATYALWVIGFLTILFFSGKSRSGDLRF
jgi:hypothetical protein